MSVQIGAVVDISKLLLFQILAQSRLLVDFVEDNTEVSVSIQEPDLHPEAIPACMAADIATNSEDSACLTSGCLASVEPRVMEAMIQSVSKFEGKVESSMHSTYNDLKPWKLLVPAERAKLPSKCVYKSRKLLQRVCSGDRKAEANGQHLSSCETSCSEESRSEGPESDEASATSIPGISNSEYHVLAVDDSMIDQKVIERLLKTSSYKGIKHLLNILLLYCPADKRLIFQRHRA
jgi:hypothetical protein